MEGIALVSELLGCGLLLFDEGMRVCHANARAGEILEILPESLSGMSLQGVDELFMDLQGKQLSAEDSPLHRTLSQKKRLVEAEFTLARKHAPPLRVSLNTSLLFHDDGRIKGLLLDFTRCCLSEERLHQFIGATDEIVFEFDAEGRYLNVWSETEELLMAPGSELIGRQVEEILPKDLAATIYSAFRQVRASGKPQVFEYSLHVGGGLHWFMARIALVPPLQGEPTFSFLARDITEQKQLGQAVRKSERRFRGLFDNAAVGIALVAPDGRCLEANQCLCDMLGYSEEELRQIPFAAYSHPEDIDADLEQFDRLLRGEIKIYSMEKRLFCKDGKEIWVHLTISPQWDEEGSPLYTIGIAENITRRKHIEAEKEHLLGELEAIFVSAGDGIIFYDEKGTILRLNNAAKEILGYTDDLVQASLAERYQQWARILADGTTLPLEESVIYRVFQGEAVKGAIGQVRRPDGEKIWISFSASPVFDVSGCQTGAVSILTDVTRLQALKDRLEDYLHMLAHDLRTPLTVISGYAEVLGEMLRASPERVLVESARAIINAADHMHAMMEDLAELGRLESGQTALHYDVIHLHEFIADFLNRQRSHDAQRIRAAVPPDLPPVRIGKNHLERIVENLVSNALKYSAPDKDVEIRAGREEGLVRLAVTDYGQGIAPDDLALIFERFYRTTSARSSAKGTGMGLYIAKRLLESYDGSIRVESTVDQGSTFTICIPEAAILPWEGATP